MGALSLLNCTMTNLIKLLVQDYPQLQFEAGETYSWSPKNGQIIYQLRVLNKEVGSWSLLHEASHALLNHRTYESDFELLLLEVAAWERAKRLAKQYGLQINDDHIQDCLDTYRDWLHKRSTCPQCTTRGLQATPTSYKCLNCFNQWGVTSARFCRSYRKTKTPA